MWTQMSCSFLVDSDDSRLHADATFASIMHSRTELNTTFSIFCSVGHLKMAFVLIRRWFMSFTPSNVHFFFFALVTLIIDVTALEISICFEIHYLFITHPKNYSEILTDNFFMLDNGMNVCFLFTVFCCVWLQSELHENVQLSVEHCVVMDFWKSLDIFIWFWYQSMVW